MINQTLPIKRPESGLTGFRFRLIIGEIMNIGQVGNSANPEAISTKAAAKVQTQGMAQTANTNAAIKKDTLMLSEKAKDLAAQQTGKGFQEEQGESQSSKMKEL
jgi:hypothetical protein